MAQADRSNGAPASTVPALERRAFRSFPYSLFVVDRDGRFAAANVEGRRLLEEMGLDEAEQTCCRLLGCRAKSSVLAKMCLTELAYANGHALPEVRVDLQTAAGDLRAVWVTAAPLRDPSEDVRVVLQLRPGAAEDRRRRTDLHWMNGPRLHIRVLGRTFVESEEGPIAGDWLDQRTGQLLKYLIAERHRAVHIDEIGENIWPGADFAIAGSVRYSVHALRCRLEPQRGRREPSRFVVSNAGRYRLNLAHVDIDADTFEARVNAGLEALEHDSEHAAVELERGLTLYGGDFLADSPYADWAMLERHRLHDLACIGLRKLASIRLDAHLVDSAARSLERLARLQPYDEGVHRQLMELDVMRGRRSDAVRRYNSMRLKIRAAFGHEPRFTLVDLARVDRQRG
jgi:DNA-binding SARP family transcriptional activator